MAYLRRMGEATAWAAWAGGAPAPWHLAALGKAHALMDEGRFEEAEARARALATARRSRPGRGRRSGTAWYAACLAATAACAHGRPEPSALAELGELIAEAERTYGIHPDLVLPARLNRAWALLDEARPAEAEAEAGDVLRALARRSHRIAGDGQRELSALTCLGHALCAQGRHEESETIARAHLPRAGEETLRPLRTLLVRSLCGLGRHEEALAESLEAAPEPPPHAVGHLELHRATALHALGRIDEARAEAARALAACERYLHPAHPRATAIRTLLSRIPPVR